MIDINSQIQKIGLQIKNMDTQFANIALKLLKGDKNTGIQMNVMGIQMLNMGIEMINIGIQLPILGTNIVFIKEQIQNIRKQIQNIETKINNIFMGTQTYTETSNPKQLNMIDMKMNNLDMKNLNVEELKNKYNSKKMITIFKTLSRGKEVLILDYGTTVNEMLKIYLERIGKNEFIIKNDKISFILNSTKIDFNNNTKIGDLFKLFSNANQPIFVKFYDS